MSDSRIFGFFSILIGGTIIVLSSFLSIMPGFLIIGVITGASILITGAIILVKYLSGRNCPVCGEIIEEKVRECAVCGHRLPDSTTASLIHRLLH